jgi:two-component system cell cycle response regulator CpdR
MEGAQMPRILIVDDEKAIRTLLSLAFTQAGFEVRTAGDGPEAMKLCLSEEFDVVLSDVVMPRMNGHDLVQWIGRRSPATQTMLMSGFDLSCEDCELAPRCKLLAKPFKPLEAVGAVERILAEKLRAAS